MHGQISFLYEGFHLYNCHLVVGSNTYASIKQDIPFDGSLICNCFFAVADVYYSERMKTFRIVVGSLAILPR